LHWQGGSRTALQVKQRLNAAGQHNPRVPEDTISTVRELARLMPDRQIARLLNRSGKTTGHGNGWTEQRVRGPNACFFGALEHGIARRAMSGAYFVSWINRSLIRFLGPSG
jgi:hypothetical protein